jgi:hypothetical protein
MFTAHLVIKVLKVFTSILHTQPSTMPYVQGRNVSDDVRCVGFQFIEIAGVVAVGIIFSVAT